MSAEFQSALSEYQDHIHRVFSDEHLPVRVCVDRHFLRAVQPHAERLISKGFAPCVSDERIKDTKEVDQMEMLMQTVLPQGFFRLEDFMGKGRERLTRGIFNNHWKEVKKLSFHKMTDKRTEADLTQISFALTDWAFAFVTDEKRFFAAADYCRKWRMLVLTPTELLQELNF